MIFPLLACVGFWILVMAASPRGNGVSLSLAVMAIAVAFAAVRAEQKLQRK